MKIGIIGTGRIGTSIAEVLAKSGNEVAISNSRGPETLADTVKGLGPNARAMSAEDAARFGEVVMIAIPFRAVEGLSLGDVVKGKIVVDVTNAFGPPGAVNLGGKTSSEIVAGKLPGARLVKAFNTIHFEHLRHQGDPKKPIDERRAIFVAGDDAAAKTTVSQLIEQAGFAPIDTGSLHEGGERQQPNSPIFNRDITAREARELLASMK